MRTVRLKPLPVITALACFLVFSADTRAEAEEWRFELTPYFWAADADVDASTLKGRTVSGEADFEDILELLDFGGFLRFEAWKNDWGLMVDGMYMDLGTEADMKVLALRINADVDMKFGNVDFSITHRFDLLKKNQKRFLWFDPIVGVRYSYLKQDIDLTFAGPIIGETAREIKDSEGWFEPMVGARVGLNLTDRLTIGVRGDAGGFYVGEGSNLTWNLFAGVGYKPWKHVSLKAGYRILDIDYERGSGTNELALNAQFKGPAAGFTIHF